MNTVATIGIPRAADLRPVRRRAAGGRPYIGPKIQISIPEAEWDFVLDLMEARGLGDEDFTDTLREVFAAGVVALGGVAP